MKLMSNAEFVGRWPALIGRCAVRALYAEVALEPKPGLVSFRDQGSHTDMTANTFYKSLFALRHYFVAIAGAGMAAQSFEVLQTLGMQAEARMLSATDGVNTHRGAVFSLGLLCAAAGWLVARGQACTASQLRSTLVSQWGDALQRRARTAQSTSPRTNGQRAAQRFHLRSANAEAAAGFPTLFEVSLPALELAFAMGLAPRSAKVHALFATMARLDDTNVAHRGGMEGVDFVKSKAAQFLENGSVTQSDWVAQARVIHAEFVARRLSPGGSADLLACACWVHEMQGLAGALSTPVIRREQVFG